MQAHGQRTVVFPLLFRGTTLEVLIDAADEPLVRSHLGTNRLGYECNRRRSKHPQIYPVIRKGRGRQVRLHRIILGLTNSRIHTDHRNGNTLDNRRGNLRVCSQGQNNQNKHKRRSASSRFKGVHWRKDIGKWGAGICVNYRKVHLGFFNSEDAAAKAYNAAAINAFGEFASLNDVGGTE